jgi:Transposase IS116/IS110/IS902 family
MRASAMNRIFGLLTQWGLRLSLRRLREPDAMQLLAQRGVPSVWRDSIVEALAVIDLLDARIAPIDRELGPLARGDARVRLLDTIPGVGDLLGLTLASEIGDVARFCSPRKLDRLRRPGAEDQPVRRPLQDRRALQGRITHAALGRRRSRTTRLAPEQPVASALHRPRRARRQEPRQVRRRAQDPDRRLARALTQRGLQARRATAAQSCLGKLPLPSGRLTAPHGIEKPRQLPRTLCEHPSAEREMSTTPHPGHDAARPPLACRPPPSSTETPAVTAASAAAVLDRAARRR